MTADPWPHQLAPLGGGQVRTQIACTAVQVGRIACWMTEHGMICLLAGTEGIRRVISAQAKSQINVIPIHSKGYKSGYKIQ